MHVCLIYRAYILILKEQNLLNLMNIVVKTAQNPRSLGRSQADEEVSFSRNSRRSLVDEQLV
jgi:hypothetical protein